MTPEQRQAMEDLLSDQQPAMEPWQRQRAMKTRRRKGTADDD